MRGLSLALAALVVAVAAAAAPQSQSRPVPSIAGTTFERQVTPFAVRMPDGREMALPFLGGLDVPRPQFVDIDGDGDLDLFLQEYSNTLWFLENTGTASAPRYTWRADRFQNLDIGEWYRFADITGDGLLDLLTESPISYIRLYRNTGSKTAPAFTDAGRLKDASGQPMFMDRQNIPALADLDCDKRLDMLVGRVEGVVDLYEATAPGADTFALIAERYEGIEIIGGSGGGGGVASAGAPGAVETPGVGGSAGDGSGGTATGAPAVRHGANALALQDFDADGDYDLFWGDFFEPAVLLIENIGRTCSTPSFQVDPVSLPFAKDVKTSGYNAPAPVDIDGDGDMDFLLGVIGGAFNPITTLEDNFIFWERTSPKSFELRSRRYLDAIDHGSDAAPAFADIDADGDLDMIVGAKIDTKTNGPGPLYLYRNTGTTKAPVFQREEPIALGSAFNLMPAIGDLDADGDLDLIAGTWNQDLLYVRNEGSAKAPKWVVDESMAIHPPRVSHAAPALADIDDDGDLDLFIGGANGAITYYRNTGSRTRPSFTLVNERLDDIKAGRRSTPALVDIDGDGLLDMVLGHEDSGPLTVYRNAGSRRAPRFVPHAALDFWLPPISAPAFADIDGDGVLDLFVGTTSGGIRFFRGARTPGVVSAPKRQP